MDLISRLKIFMEYVNIPVTKFADICNIPRPSMTQLLKGRNRKVSDEVIAKIHASYPMLNISWLMFGEGEMVDSENFKMSESQTEHKIEETPVLTPESKENNPYPHDLFSIDEFGSEKKIPTIKPDNIIKSIRTQTNSDSNRSDASEESPRYVTNIMVFYSDNSFENFIPQNGKL